MKKCKECTPTPMMALNEVSCIYYQKVHAKEPRINKSYRYILYHLANRDGISQLEIANLTHLKPPTISITLHAMEEAGSLCVRRIRVDRIRLPRRAHPFQP